MEKKYVIVVTKDPYTRNDGFMIHPATSYVLDNKVYSSKEEADEVANAYIDEHSQTTIEKQFRIPENIFCRLRDFIINNYYINIDGVTVSCKKSKNAMIGSFLDMYGLAYNYDETMFDEDEKTFQKLMFDEPIVKVIEVSE